MDGAAIAQWVAVGIIAIGLITTLVRNGRNQARSRGSMEAKVDNIEKELHDENHGLSALKDEISDIKTHCARVSSGLTEKVKTHEKTLDELKKKRKR